ncbi:MAG: hypothetical protein JWP69_1752 [Flaviaesturariibacter sp.]|nr:hypothetical protein [Flaviaesturariibacter sp.]
MFIKHGPYYKGSHCTLGAHFNNKQVKVCPFIEEKGFIDLLKHLDRELYRWSNSLWFWLKNRFNMALLVKNRCKLQQTGTYGR